jgi:hypothetical protein
MTNLPGSQGSGGAVDLKALDSPRLVFYSGWQSRPAAGVTRIELLDRERHRSAQGRAHIETIASSLMQAAKPWRLIRPGERAS